MATILEFPARASGAQASVDRVVGQNAGEVVIFPGVRYERPTEAAAKPRARRARQRDRLELDD
jgi:hypothetical protein